MTDRIKQIETQIANLLQDVSVLEEEMHGLLEDVAGVHVGDVVTVARRRGERFDVLVDRVDTRWDKPWIHGFKRKKDGTWGSQSHAYYSDWEVQPREEQ